VRTVPAQVRGEARRLVREHYGDMVRAWLVGSRVEGGHGPRSDLDVVVEVIPSTMKAVDGKVVGAGVYVVDTGLGFPVDITEDGDGPFGGPGRSVRIQ
jgi:predicted nucleotidyltransferase